jgi:putative hydrolase of the HAD superfamily
MSNQPRPSLALDFGRVLTLEPDKNLFDPMVTRAGLDHDAFRQAYSLHRHEYDRGSLDARTYWGRILGACRPGIGTSEVEFYLPALLEADFLSWAQPRLGLHRIIERALDAGVPTAIVSNMPEGIGDRFVQAWPWLGKIPHRFFSADFGLTKPDEAFYHHVLKKTGWRPGDVLFVDDLEVNIEAARRMGFATLLFTGSDGDLGQIARWCGLTSPAP